MSSVILRLNKVSKLFNSKLVVDDLSLEVEEAKVFTLLGPSGCGKTTTLRMIAGLERPDFGEIIYQGRTLVSVSQRYFVPSYERKMGMVFQSYGIWPHMTVFENVAYPMRLRKVGRKTIQTKVEQALDLVGLTGLEDRPAPLLSGGQQQRVAIARALVYEPGILLLDEPFSNLDAKLRERMRLELRLLQRRVGITIVFVTHDQVEALSLSDRIAVMNHGLCEQYGTPQELYEQPATPFVRDFVGHSVILKGSVRSLEGDSEVAFSLSGTEDVVQACSSVRESLAAGKDACMVFRPEYAHVEPVNHAGPEKAGPVQNGMLARIHTLLFVGDRYESRLILDGGQEALLYLSKSDVWQEGLRVRVSLPPERVSIWPA